MSRKITLFALACIFLNVACATSRKPASDTSVEDKVQYEKYVRKVERQEARFSDRLQP